MKNIKLELLSLLKKPRRFHRYKNPILPYVVQTKVAVDDNTAENLKKGHAFEEFIVRLFDQDLFTLLEWRSDKEINGVSPFMSRFPDLEFYYKSDTQELHFAIECKWQQNFYDEGIELSDYQLTNYRQFQIVTGIPTFIIWGIGNIASRPNTVYVIPLNDFTVGKMHEFSLTPFQRHVIDKNFFLDCQKKTLK